MRTNDNGKDCMFPTKMQIHLTLWPRRTSLY